MMYFDALPSRPCAHVPTAVLLTADYRQVHRPGVQQLAVRAGAGAVPVSATTCTARPIATESTASILMLWYSHGQLSYFLCAKRCGRIVASANQAHMVSGPGMPESFRHDASLRSL